MSDVLLKVDSLGKKFSKNFRKGLMYGAMDVGREIFGSRNANAELRPHEFWALQDVSFELRRGETLGLIGANGAGKSTLLKLLYGVMKPSAGRICIDGTMQALIELGGMFAPTLSGRENIQASAAMIGMSKAEISKHFDSIVEFAELDDFIDAPVGTYSSGMRVRLGFAIATCISPDILILDEVLAVGDAAFRAKSMKRVAELKESAGGILFVSHNTDLIDQMCSRCIYLQNGKLIADGPTDEVTAIYMKNRADAGIARGIADQAPAARVEEVHVESDGDVVNYSLDVEVETPMKEAWVVLSVTSEAILAHSGRVRVEALDNYKGRAVVSGKIDPLPVPNGNYDFGCNFFDSFTKVSINTVSVHLDNTRKRSQYAMLAPEITLGVKK